MKKSFFLILFFVATTTPLISQGGGGDGRLELNAAEGCIWPGGDCQIYGGGGG